jgi:hypothetical protein
VETKTPEADEQIADEADKKHSIVFVAKRIGNSLVS